MESQQRDELAAWQAGGAFGVITALDPRTRNITLRPSRPGGASEVKVDASGPVRYESFSAGSSTGLPASWNQLSVGDYVYVRGEKTADATAMAARLIVAGGLRTFTGTIESIDILDEQIRIRTLLSGTVRTVHVDPGVLHAISPGGPMRGIWLADLQPGDPVLVLAQGGGEAGDVQALAVLASFSSFGFGKGENERLPWFF